MPASQECPLCGGTMKIKASTTVTHVPGNPSATDSDHNGMGMP